MKKLNLKEIRAKKKLEKVQRLIKKIREFSLAHTYGSRSALNMGGQYVSKSMATEQAKQLYGKKVFNAIRNALVEENPEYKYISDMEILNILMKI